MLLRLDRLNKKLYDRGHFLERGMEHVESAFSPSLWGLIEAGLTGAWCE